MPKRSRKENQLEADMNTALPIPNLAAMPPNMSEIARVFDQFAQSLASLVNLTPSDDFDTSGLSQEVEDRVVVAKVLKRMHQSDQLSWLNQYLPADGASVKMEPTPKPLHETDSSQAGVTSKKIKLEAPVAEKIQNAVAKAPASPTDSVPTAQDLATVAKERLERVATADGHAAMIKGLQQQYSYDDVLEDDHWPPEVPVIHNEQLRQQAFTHRSFATASAPPQATKSMLTNIHNERLEFLGDSYLNYAMTRLLYVKMPTAREGELSLLRAELIGNETAAELGRMYGFDKALLLNETAERDGVRKGTKVIADTFEAFLGAVTLDGIDGPARADRWLRLLMGPRIAKHILDNDIELVNPLAKQKIYNYFSKKYPLVVGPDGNRKTPVTILYEWVDGKGGNEGGYVIACKVKVGTPKVDVDGTDSTAGEAKEVGRGWGPNKKEAEHRAAMNAVRMLGI
jgi:ribonuclease-3